MNPGEVWGWEVLVLSSCKHKGLPGESHLGKAGALWARSALCLGGHFRKAWQTLRKRKWPWKDSLRGFSETQTKAQLWCNDWRGKSSEIINFLTRRVEDMNDLITAWPSHIPSLRNDTQAYTPLEDHKYCYSTDRRQNKTFIPWHFGKLVRRFMTPIKFRTAK